MAKALLVLGEHGHLVTKAAKERTELKVGQASKYSSTCLDGNLLQTALFRESPATLGHSVDKIIPWTPLETCQRPAGILDHSD